MRSQEVDLAFPGPIHALDGVNLEIGRGEFVSIVGPSGCGKSTLLRIVAGLLRPSRGALTVSGMAAAAARRSKTRMSFVFQDPTLLPWRNVAGNIRLPLELERVERSARPARIRQNLELIGLEAFARRYPRELSGGMRMRVSLARALVTEPDLLLLDEPFAALDDITRQALNEELLGLWLRRRWTGIFVTHNIAEAVFLSQRVLVMSRRPGKIVADVAVPFAGSRQPALRAEPEFARLCGQISDTLRRAAA